MKKGLILEGGAMRGMFTAGVIDVMMEHGIRYDGVIGVSAGARGHQMILPPEDLAGLVDATLADVIK